MIGILQQVVQDVASPDSLALSPTASDAVIATADSLLSGKPDPEMVGQLIATGQFSEFGHRVKTLMTDAAAGLVPEIIGAILVFLLLYLTYRFVGALLDRLLKRGKRVDQGVQSLLKKTYRIFAFVLIAVMVLAQFGVNITALLAGLSIAGVAIGFAAKDTLENFISGVTILLDKPFAIGDVIEVDGTYGVVEDLTLRSTRVRTVKRQIMVLPNIHMVNQKVINYTMMGAVRVDIDFGVAYKEYPEEARKVVLPLTEGDERLHSAFPPTVVVTSLNDSSVDMQLRVFLEDARLENQIRVEYTEKIRAALRQADIEIPFPHLQLFVDGAKALESSTLFLPPGDPER